MATLAQFSQNIRKRGSQIENAGTRFVKTTAKRALKNLVNTTPVDTGKARSNWRVGIGAPVRSPIETYGSASAARAAINAGFARINSVRGVSGGGGGLKTAIYISNALDYPGHLPNERGLNDGASKQAPRYYIETALAEAVGAIRNMRVFVGGPGDEEGEE